MLGQVISGSGPDGVTYAEAVAQLGMTDATLLDATIDALAAHDGAGLFTVIDRIGRTPNLEEHRLAAPLVISH